MHKVEVTTSSRNDGNTVLPAVPFDGNGNELHEGDRVFIYEHNDYLEWERFYGTLHKNEDYPNVSEWYIAYDDGQEFAVLEMSLVFKA